MANKTIAMIQIRQILRLHSQGKSKLQIASLLDVHCSNSLIEAHNKAIKYNYLYKMAIADERELRKAMKWICDDFNNRPHISINGLTPNERHSKISLDVDSLKAKKKIAAEEWKKFNFKNRRINCAA